MLCCRWCGLNLWQAKTLQAEAVKARADVARAEEAVRAHNRHP